MQGHSDDSGCIARASAVPCWRSLQRQRYSRLCAWRFARPLVVRRYSRLACLRRQRRAYSSARGATVSCLRMGRPERLLASFEETESLTRPTSPLTAPKLGEAGSGPKEAANFRRPSLGRGVLLLRSEAPHQINSALVADTSSQFRPAQARFKQLSPAWLKSADYRVASDWLKKWYRP